MYVGTLDILYIHDACPSVEGHRHHPFIHVLSRSVLLLTTFAAFTLALSCHSIVLLRRCCVVVALHWVVASLLCTVASL